MHPHSCEELSFRVAPCSLSSCNPLLCPPLGDQYALKMRFVDHVFDEQVTDSLTVKIVLPEGAK